MHSNTHLPPRNVVLGWESERDKLAAEIRAATAKLDILQAKIDDAWVARTPFLNFDLQASILERFVPPKWFHTEKKGHGAVDAEERARINALLQLCQVSKKWLNPSRRLLYHDVAQVDATQAPLLAATLKELPRVGTFVRRLGIGETGFEIGNHLHLMPNITHICRHDLIVKKDLQQLLLLRHLRHAVFLRGWLMWTAEEWEAAYAAWPHLKTLSVPNDRSSSTEVSLHSGGSSGFPSLRRIEWAGVAASASSIPFTAEHTLRSIKLSDVALSPEILDHIVTTQSQSLEQLEIVRCTGHAHVPFIELVKSIPNLKRLYAYKNDDLDLPDPMALPIQLAEVAVQWRDCTPEQATAFISERTANAGPLRRFRIVELETRGAEEEWAQVTAAALALGVSFFAEAESPSRGDGADFDADQWMDESWLDEPIYFE